MTITHRLVSKTEAATPDAACEAIRLETGGQVQHAQGFEVVDEGDHWRVPVFSTDRHASMPMLPHGAVFPGNNCLSATEIEKQISQFERPEFESKGGDGPGWELGRATGPGFAKR
jgi:hypothetical protein